MKYSAGKNKFVILKTHALIIAVLSVLLSIPAASALPAYPADNGAAVLDLTGHDFEAEGPVKLDCPWDFFWNRLVEPGSAQWNDVSPDHHVYPVPLFWTAYPGRHFPSVGYGTYRLIIKTSGKDKEYAVKTPEIFSEYRLWINGNILDQHGTIAGSAIRFLKPDVFAFHSDSSLIEIVLQVKNSSHGNAGIGQSFIFGTESQVYKRYIIDISLEIILIAVCLFAGLYHAVIYIFRREEKELLYFGLFCMVIAIRTFTTGNTLISQLWPDLPFGIGSRITTVVIPLSVITFQAFAYYFFRSIAPRIPYVILTALQMIYLALVLTTPTLFYSTVYTYYLLAILASFVYVIGINLTGIIRKVPYAKLFFACLLLMFAGAANDMLHYLQVINTGYYLALFFSVFIIMQSIILAVKFSQEHRVVAELSEKLKTLDKLKDEFLANTSHELRTPLNGIIGIAESLIDGATGTLSDKTRRNLELIVSSGKRLYSLINDILDFSRLKNNDIVLQKKSVDLRQLVSIVITVMQTSMTGTSVRLINDIPEGLPLVEGDENRLQQIMYNLIGNALKFTPSGYVRISAAITANRVEVSVEDTGIGIEADRLDAIFTSFEQADGSTSREYGGTGLGLSITRKLIELHGGNIRVESQPGKGTRFKFILPGLLEKGAAARQPLSVPALADSVNGTEYPTGVVLHQDAEKHREKILVVDDEPVNIQVLLNHLAVKKYRADFASDGFEAIEKIEREDYDLVLLDIMMPRMSGYEVCRKVREKYTAYELPIIILTAKNRNADIVAALDAGANDYLIKPLDRVVLFARMETQLSLKYAVREALENTKLANTDQLTGMYNRRFFMNSGQREFARTQFRKSDMSVIMMDIDYFKSINDRFGHDAGDLTIQRMASLIVKQLRSTDIACRYGGDEFLILLPGTGPKEALTVAEKIRTIAAACSLDAADGRKILFTTSLGVSFYRPGCESFDAILKEADEMLYASKSEGRNRVAVYRPETGSGGGVS